jgi:hypothetical protein
MVVVGMADLAPEGVSGVREERAHARSAGDMQSVFGITDAGHTATERTVIHIHPVPAMTALRPMGLQLGYFYQMEMHCHDRPPWKEQQSNNIIHI